MIASENNILQTYKSAKQALPLFCPLFAIG